MNPFNTPDEPFDLTDFLQNDPIKVDILFKNFFQQQVEDEISNDLVLNYLRQKRDKMIVPIQLKNYHVKRQDLNVNPNYQKLNVEIIQALCLPQAVYLFLLHENKSSESYPFYEALMLWEDMGPLTPYDLYSLVISSLFDKDISFNDYLVEIDKIDIIKPDTFSLNPIG